MRYFVILLFTVLVLMVGFLYWSYQRVRSVPMERLKALKKHEAVVSSRPENLNRSFRQLQRQMQQGKPLVMKESEVEGIVRDWIEQQYPQYREALQGLQVRIKKQAVEMEALVNLQRIPRNQLPTELQEGLRWYRNIFGSKGLDKVYVKVRAIPQVVNGELRLASGSYVQIGGMKIQLQQMPKELRHFQWHFGNQHQVLSRYQHLELQDGQLILKAD